MLNFDSSRFPAHFIVCRTNEGTHDVGALGQINAELNKVDQLAIIRDEEVVYSFLVIERGLQLSQQAFMVDIRCLQLVEDKPEANN